MNILLSLKEKFKTGEITKGDYIDEMYKYHTLLFDYIDLLSQSDIDLITIDQNRIICRFKKSGIKFICTKGDKRLAPIDSMNFGEYEPQELEMSLNLIKKEDVIFDVGANFGWYSMNIALKYPNCKLYAFEPIPNTYHNFYENIQLNNFENILPSNIGLSDEEGSFMFYYDDTLSVNASLTNVSDNKNIKNIECFVSTIDLFIEKQKIKKIDFIKCDVEGAEFLVFKGGFKTIKRDKPIIFSEILRKWSIKFNYHPNNLIAYLNELGYSCFVLRNNGLLNFDKVDENTVDTNYFFLHKEKHQAQIQQFILK